MFCANCGKELLGEVAFCDNCGAAQRVARDSGKIKDETLHRTRSAVNVNVNSIGTAWNNSFFDGSLIGLIGVNLATFFLSLITLGFAWPALICYRLRWIYKHTVVGGYRLKFTGKGIQLFGRCWLWGFLTVITFTIYAWWLPIKYQKWETSHIEIDSVIPTAQYVPATKYN